MKSLFALAFAAVLMTHSAMALPVAPASPPKICANGSYSQFTDEVLRVEKVKIFEFNASAVAKYLKQMNTLRAAESLPLVDADRIIYAFLSGKEYPKVGVAMFKNGCVIADQVVVVEKGDFDAFNDKAGIVSDEVVKITGI